MLLLKLCHLPVSLCRLSLQLSGETEVEHGHGCQVLELTLSHVPGQLLTRDHNTAPKLLHLTGHRLQGALAAMLLQITPLHTAHPTTVRTRLWKIGTRWPVPFLSFTTRTFQSACAILALPRTRIVDQGHGRCLEGRS